MTKRTPLEPRARAGEIALYSIDERLGASKAAVDTEGDAPLPRSIFISLPVADVARSTAFYEAIGFEKNAQFSGEHASSMKWSDTVTINVLDTQFYQTLTPKRIIDAHTTSGVLIALSLDSKAAVDAITEAAVGAGGQEAHGAEDDGFMYSRAFTDPDGHGFGPVWMDVDAAAAAMASRSS